jgi:hypothetical protein
MARKPTQHTSATPASYHREVDAAEGLIDVVRGVCDRLPEVEEKLSHGVPALFVRGKKAFVYVWWHGHHDLDFPHLWCAAPAGQQEALIACDPERFFRPPYVGHRGWIGVRLDRGVDQAELSELCEEAYRTVAPAALIQTLDESME